MFSDTVKAGNTVGNLTQLREYWPHRTNMHVKSSQNTVKTASAEVPELEEKARTSYQLIKSLSHRCISYSGENTGAQLLRTAWKALLC